MILHDKYLTIVKKSFLIHLLFLFWRIMYIDAMYSFKSNDNVLMKFYKSILEKNEIKIVEILTNVKNLLLKNQCNKISYYFLYLL